MNGTISKYVGMKLQRKIKVALFRRLTFRILKKIVLALIIIILTGASRKISYNPPTGLMCGLTECKYIAARGDHSLAALSKHRAGGLNNTPLICEKNPGFSWEMSDRSDNVEQTAYQILVSDNDHFNSAGSTWNSGKVMGSTSCGVVYQGPPLKSQTAYYWKVRVWNKRQVLSAFSRIAVFFTGKKLFDHQPSFYRLQISEQKPVNFVKIHGVFRADFGKDAFGRLKFTLTADRADSVIVRLGETVNADGTINRHPPGTVRYSQYAVKIIKGEHTYQLAIRKDARNTGSAAIKMPDDIGEVTPFRYAEIEAGGLPLAKKDIKQLAVHYFFDKNRCATFRCSDPTLNAVWELCKYSVQATSFTGLFVDGDRERIPYEADAYIAQLSDYAINREFTLARNSGEYLIDHPTWPTEWILQSVLIAWHDYLYTGDKSYLQRYYGDLKAKSLLALEDSSGLISTRNGKMTRDVLTSIHFNSDLKDIVDWPAGTETDGFVFTKYNSVVNAFYYKDLVLLSRIADSLGKKKDAFFFEERSKSVKKAYQKAFFDTVNGGVFDGPGTQHKSLHSNMFALIFGLVDVAQQKAVVDLIKSKGMACSVYGAQFLLDAVYLAGESDYGFSLLTSRSDRSWYNMIAAGSTLTMEAWDNKFKFNQDWNHVWGAAPANIISRKLMGIEPLQPGWTTFSVKPQISSLSFASINVPTVKGSISASYSQSVNKFQVILHIPPNTKAAVYLPVNDRRLFRVLKNHRDVSYKMLGHTALMPLVGSGIHHFDVVYL